MDTELFFQQKILRKRTEETYHNISFLGFSRSHVNVTTPLLRHRHLRTFIAEEVKYVLTVICFLDKKEMKLKQFNLHVSMRGQLANKETLKKAGCQPVPCSFIRILLRRHMKMSINFNVD